MIVTVDVIRTNITDLDPAGRPGPIHGRVIVWFEPHGWKLAWEWPLRDDHVRADW